MGIGYAHSCAMMTGNVLKCWGLNANGQIGDGTTTQRTKPVGIVFASVGYTYDSNHKHAVSDLSTGEDYTYDANGNMITRIEGGLTYTQTFDAENRLISITAAGATTQFIYDGDGNLVKKVNSDGSRTLYVGGIYEVDKNAAGTVTGTKTYYPAGGAMRVGSTLYYMLKDHLGSASVLTNTSGSIVTSADVRYYPFGEARFSTTPMFTDKLFTGQREITGLGIYHYGARFYSPKLGRFLSADTIVPGYANPQNLNRFSYVINNPLRYTDPSGHAVACGSDAGNGCEGTGLGGLTPGQILETNVNDDRRNRAIYNYAITHPDYNYAQDTELEDVGRFIVSNALFIGNADAVSRQPSFWDRVSASWEALAYGGALSIAAILAGGGSNPYGYDTPFVPNPGGMNGNPDHGAGVKYVTKLAEQQYPEVQGYSYRYNVSIKEFNGGIDRRPDLTVWHGDDLIKIYEVARTYPNGSMVTREQLKMVEYWENGLPYFFHLLK
jgi:RHS repeat-associated protein